MFEIKKLLSPETVLVPGGSITLTHEAWTMAVNPADKENAMVVGHLKGFINADGDFQDYGPHVREAMDAKGLADLLADTSNGKAAGAFSTSDVAAAIVKRQNERRAEKVAAEKIEEDAAKAEFNKLTKQAANPKKPE